MAVSIEISMRASSVSSMPDCFRKSAVQLLTAEEKRFFGIGFGKNNASAAVGTGMHAAFEHVLTLKKNGRDFTMKDVMDGIDKGTAKFDEETATNAFWDKTTPHAQTAHKQIHAMVRAAVPILRTIDPLYIEQYFECVVSPLGEQAATRVKLTAHLDLVSVIKTLWDHKSGASIPSPFGQMGVYITTAEKNDCPIDDVAMLYVPRLGVTKLDDIVAQVIPMDRNECVRVARTNIKSMQWQYEQYLESKTDDAGEVLDVGKPDVFPANPGSRLCTPNYCLAFKSGWCKVGGATKPQTSDIGEF